MEDNMLTKTCPDCGGVIEGHPAIDVPINLATGKGDYIWQCRGTCEMFIFNCPPREVDGMLRWLCGK